MPDGRRTRSNPRRRRQYPEAYGVLEPRRGGCLTPAKIRWGVPGDFARCEAELGKYVEPEVVKGLCSNLHVRATGARPGHAPGEQAAHQAKQQAKKSE